MTKRILASLAAFGLVLASVLIGTPAQAVTTYHYAIGEQFGLNADGAAVNLTVESPHVNSAHDGSSAHSIAELAVFSTDRKNRIEVGWRKGTASHTVFTYHTVNGALGGYNGCTDYAANSVNAGSTIPAAWVGDKVNPPRFQIIHSGTAWWIAVGGAWLCHYPDTLWTSQSITWNKVNQVQAYGEVASTTTATPCSDMGDGQPASSGTAARIGSYSLQGQSPALAAAFTTRTQPTTAGVSVSVQTTTTFRYGWEGYSAANTLPGVTGNC